MADEVKLNELEVEVAVVKQRQDDMDRRQKEFMAAITKTMDDLNRSLKSARDDVNSIHGHITRCRNEINDELTRDFSEERKLNRDTFLTEGDAEKIRGSIKEINTKLYMTGIGIVFALSLVQVAISVYS